MKYLINLFITYSRILIKSKIFKKNLLFVIYIWKYPNYVVFIYISYLLQDSVVVLCYDSGVPFADPPKRCYIKTEFFNQKLNNKRCTCSSSYSFNFTQPTFLHLFLEFVIIYSDLLFNT